MKLLSADDSRFLIETIDRWFKLQAEFSSGDIEIDGDRLLSLRQQLQKGIDEEPDPRCQAFRNAADQKYASEGSIEVDDGAVVSEGDGDGAYVQAWVWVYCEDAGLPSKLDDEEADNEDEEGTP